MRFKCVLQKASPKSKWNIHVDLAGLSRAFDHAGIWFRGLFFLPFTLLMSEIFQISQFLLCYTFAGFNKLSSFATPLFLYFFNSNLLALGARRIRHWLSHRSEICRRFTLRLFAAPGAWLSAHPGAGWRELLPVQAAFLSSFPAVYSELLKLFDVREVASVVQDTLGSLPAIMHVDDALHEVKLQCISKTVESQLYTNPGGRRVPASGLQQRLQEGGWNPPSPKPRVVDGRKKLSRSPVQRQGYQNFISRENGNPDDGIMTSDHNQLWGRTCLLVTDFISFLCSTELSVFFQRCLKGPDWILVFLLNVFCWFVLWNWVRVLMDCSLLFYANGKWLI